jgi:hypothetical protein
VSRHGVPEWTQLLMGTVVDVILFVIGVSLVVVAMASAFKWLS